MFQVPASISKITTMGDRSLRLQVDVSQELTPEENAKVFQMYNTLGYFIFKDAAIEPDEIDTPEYVKEFKTDKTPSQRLRGVFYRLWEQEGSKGSFDDFYKSKMEQLINHYKEKLDA